MTKPKPKRPAEWRAKISQSIRNLKREARLKMESLRVVESLESRVAKLQGDIQAANAELPVLAAQLCEARAVYSAEVAKAQEIRFGELKAELTEQCAALDSNGWNPAGERRVTEILATFRMVRRSGQSAETLRHYIEQLKNPNGGRQARRTWSGLVDWVKAAPMSHGYNGSKRFANYVSHAPLPAVKRDVTFRKTEPTESPAMSTVAKVWASMAKSGEYSATDVAYMHKAWALEMFPLAKNGDVALAKFYETETGKLALSDAVKSEHAALQESARIGDGDQFVAKLEKGECEISHDHPKQTKQKAKQRWAGRLWDRPGRCRKPPA
jgi:hypothetical protein